MPENHSDQSSAAERRIDRRLPLRIQVEYECMEDFLVDYTANVSIGGMFIETPNPQPIGTSFRLRFELPGLDHYIDTTAEVRWVMSAEEAGTLPPGMGIRFADLTPEDQVHVQNLIRNWK